MKSYKNCFELEGGSSYGGFELPGVTDCLKFLSDRNFPFIADFLSRSVHALLIRMSDLMSRLFDYQIIISLYSCLHYGAH